MADEIWGLASGLLMAVAISSSAFAKTWSSPALQRAYFAKVAKISRGIVRPLKDENSPILNYSNAIFEVDLEGNGSKYVASQGKAMVDIRSAPPGVEISRLLEVGEPSRVIEKGDFVILILNSGTGKLTIMSTRDVDESWIRPLRWKGKNRNIPYGADCASAFRDRDAVAFGEIGPGFISRHGKAWKLRKCIVE